MSFLSDLWTFIRLSKEIDIEINTVEMASILYKVHPEVVDMQGLVPANQLTVLGEYKDLLDKSLGNVTKMSQRSHLWCFIYRGNNCKQ